MGGYYDYAKDGLRWGTDDDEFNFGIRAMQQLDARIYANPNQEYASNTSSVRNIHREAG